MAETQPVPLAVDLDGTLIRTDMMFESIARLLRRNPFALFQILWWWSRGRARLKQELVRRVQLDPATLPYHEPFLDWLRHEKQAGRALILATASDIAMARPIADHVQLFDEVLGSDGQTNLRSEAKLRALTEKFGERGFDYAGNSPADYAVWRGSRQAVVVNASPAVRQQAAQCTQLGPVFCQGYRPLEIPRRMLLELFWRSGYLLAGLAGGLLTAAFPGLELAGFAWMVPALLLFAARGLRGADSFRAGYVGGLVFWLGSLHWLLLIPVAGFPILGWLALSAYLALYSGAWVWLTNRLRPTDRQNEFWGNRATWALTGAAAWVALEFLRGWFLSGFPWSFLGVSQFRLVPLIQLTAFTGVYGLSFLMVWLSLAVYSAALRIWKEPGRRFVWQAEVALPLVTVLSIYLWGFFTAGNDAATEDRVRVTLVQPSVPIQQIWESTPESDRRRFAGLLAQSQRALAAAPTDVLLWPESGVPPATDEVYGGIVQFARANHVWIIFDGDDAETHGTETNYFNSALLLDAGGHLRQVYHKRRLVMFGEYIPLVHTFPFLKWLSPIGGGWTPGDRQVQFNLTRRNPGPTNEIAVVNLVAPGQSPPPGPRTTFRASPLICFEDTFPAAGRAATEADTDLLVNLTNDGWFGDGSEQWQHAAAAVFRAVENGRPLVRCANNGISCLIDRRGRVTRQLTGADQNVHSAGSLTVEVPLDDRAEETYYHQHGDWFAWSCSGLTLLGVVRFTLRRKDSV